MDWNEPAPGWQTHGTVDKIDASAIDNSDGVDVTLIIGFMVATERINMRVGGLTYIAEE